MNVQENAILSIHLLQSCLVFVNTLTMQDVLTEPKRYACMTDEDWCQQRV